MDGSTDSADREIGQLRQSDLPSFFAETVRRLPLAASVLHLLGYALDEEFLSTCYAEHRGHGYEGLLSFPRLVDILADALLVHHGSARQSLLEAEKHQTLPTCKEAFYGKLRRLPLSLSVALLTQASQRLNALLPVQDNPLPTSLHGYQIRIIDGKKTKHIAKTLGATRGQAGQLFGAKLLAAYDPATRLIQAIAAHPDGERNDGPLVPELLQNLQTPAVEGPRINVADAQFCDLVQMHNYRQNEDYFVLRYHPKLHFHPVAGLPPVEDKDARNRPLIEEYGWVGSVRDKRRRFVRRITWKRHDHKDLSIVTDLTNRQDAQAVEGAESIPATDLIDLYLTRWKIETVFQDVTEIFGLRKFIGSTPEATAFQSAFCMVVYNTIIVIKSYVAALQPKPISVDDVSNQMLFTSIHKQLTAIAELVPPEITAELIKPSTSAIQAKAYLKQRLNGLWEPAWRKAQNKSPRQYTDKPQWSGAHTSVYRLQQKHRQKTAKHTIE